MSDHTHPDNPDRDTTHPAGATVPRGTWVEVRRVVLGPDERAAHLPPDTAATPLVQWVNGFLDDDAQPGEEVSITSLAGRHHRGVLERVNPSYDHGFGATVPELLTIGTAWEPLTGPDHPDSHQEAR